MSEFHRACGVIVDGIYLPFIESSLPRDVWDGVSLYNGMLLCTYSLTWRCSEFAETSRITESLEKILFLFLFWVVGITVLRGYE